jgi:DNA-binding NtrC family response regulator
MTRKKHQPLLTVERVLVAMAQTDNNVAAAASRLGVHRVSLYRFLRDNGLRMERGRPRIVKDGPRELPDLVA